MTLRPLSDVSPAAWFLRKPSSSLLGPAGFESYARVLHGEVAGERAEGHLDDALLAALASALEGHTTSADTCFFGLWDGYGAIHGGEAAGFLTAFTGSPRWPGRVFGKERPRPLPPPAFPPAVMDGPRLHADHDYLLFSGPLAEAGNWGALPYGPGLPRGRMNSPNLMWPADQAWFVTTNIDSDWTGVAGSAGLIATLLREPRLEVVRARPDEIPQEKS